jgi:hypothetical protein
MGLKDLEGGVWYNLGVLDLLVVLILGDLG